VIRYEDTSGRHMVTTLRAHEDLVTLVREGAPVQEIVDDPFPDDEAMRRLWLAAWGDAGPASFQPILARSLAHVCAQDGSRLIGFVNVAWDGGIHAFILDTCVDPDYRQRGIALRLVARAAELARQRGAQWLHVDFEPHLEAFYRKAGFGPTAAGLMRLAP
jgi:GNAT superfamily N-acetyltransferase